MIFTMKPTSNNTAGTGTIINMTKSKIATGSALPFNIDSGTANIGFRVMPSFRTGADKPGGQSPDQGLLAFAPSAPWQAVRGGLRMTQSVAVC